MHLIPRYESRDGKQAGSIIYLTHGGGPLPLLGDLRHRELVDFLTQIPATLINPAPTGKTPFQPSPEALPRTSFLIIMASRKNPTPSPTQPPARHRSPKKFSNSFSTTAWPRALTSIAVMTTASSFL